MVNNNRNGNRARKKDEITCVQLTKVTRDKLASLGSKKDTFEDIIVNLIDSPCTENSGESQDDE